MCLFSAASSSGRWPAGTLLFFACPKKSRQKKGHPDGWPSASLRVPCVPRPNPALGNSPISDGLRHPSLFPGLVCGTRLRRRGHWHFRSLVGAQRNAQRSAGSTLATPSRRATQKPTGAGEGCLSDRRERSSGQESTSRRLRRPKGEGQGCPETIPERGRLRVAQGSPGNAGAGLLEQMLLVTFGDKQLAAQNSRRLARRASFSE